MNKGDLINEIAKKTKVAKVVAKNTLQTLLDTIKTALKKGEKISIPGFGTFLTVKRRERTGINPKTKQKIKIPATVVPKFKAGKGLKAAVAKK